MSHRRYSFDNHRKLSKKAFEWKYGDSHNVCDVHGCMCGFSLYPINSQFHNRLGGYKKVNGVIRGLCGTHYDRIEEDPK